MKKMQEKSFLEDSNAHKKLDRSTPLCLHHNCKKNERLHYVKECVHLKKNEAMCKSLIDEWKGKKAENKKSPMKE